MTRLAAAGAVVGPADALCTLPSCGPQVQVHSDHALWHQPTCRSLLPPVADRSGAAASPGTPVRSTWSLTAPAQLPLCVKVADRYSLLVEQLRVTGQPTQVGLPVALRLVRKQGPGVAAERLQADLMGFVNSL